MAEGAFRKATQDAGCDIPVDSVGTASYHVDERPDPRTIKIARAHGIDLSHARGRQLADEDFHRFTHIYAMDTANLAAIKTRAPRHGGAKIALLLDVFEDRQGQSVPDPYHGNEEDFAACWTQISEATSEIAIRLIRQSTGRV